MADYHFHVKRVKRNARKSVVASAAYRAGEKLKDNYYGLIHDYSKKEVAHSAKEKKPPRKISRPNKNVDEPHSARSAPRTIGVFLLPGSRTVRAKAA